MTDGATPNAAGPTTSGVKGKGKISPEPLALRAKPQPVIRINRRVLIGGAAVILSGIAALVLVALTPPSLRSSATPELYNVDRKPISDRLAGLPATYDGTGDRSPKSVERPSPIAGKLLQVPSADPAIEAERVEKARLARLAGQAREAPVFFRLQLKPAAREATSAGNATSEPIPGRQAPAASASRALIALRAAERARGLAGDSIDQPSGDATDQSRRLAFLNSSPDKEIYNPHPLQTPASPYPLMAGTIIAASLVSGLNSDLPGFVIAQVTENIFDSVAGRHLLIPQGSRLVGKYDNVVAFGQQRALVVWQRIILPDGTSVVIDSLPATDTGGYAGLSDEIDLHTWKLLKGVALATVLGIGNSLAFGNSDSDLLKALRESAGQTTNRAGQRLVEKNLNVQPTLTVRPGWPLRVIVHKDIILRSYRASPTR
jgi:type IV secretion system protein VirB10